MEDSRWLTASCQIGVMETKLTGRVAEGKNKLRKAIAPCGSAV
jgi:hypothetical protein